MAEVEEGYSTLETLIYTSMKELRADSSGALRVFSQLNNEPLLSGVLSEHADEVRRAFLDNNKTLAEVLFRILSAVAPTLPPQIQRANANTIDPDALALHVQALETFRKNVKPAAHALCLAHTRSNRKWIEKLVRNWARFIPENKRKEFSDELANTIVVSAQRFPQAAPQNVLQNVLLEKNVPPARIPALVGNTEITKRVHATQRLNPAIVERIIADAALSSPCPDVALAYFTQISQRTPIDTVAAEVSVRKMLDAATRVAERATILTGNASEIWPGVSKNGTFHLIATTPFQKAMAPFADVLLSVFPQSTQQSIILRVVKKSWGDQVKHPQALEKILGAALHAPIVASAIQHNTQALNKASILGASLSPLQKILADIYTTIFHPDVSSVYLQLAGLYAFDSTIPSLQVFGREVFTPLGKQTQISLFQQCYQRLWPLASPSLFFLPASMLKQRETTLKEELPVSPALSAGSLSAVGRVFAPAGLFGERLIGWGASFMEPLFSFVGRIVNFSGIQTVFERLFSTSGGHQRVPWHRDLSIVFPLFIIGVLIIPLITPLFGGTTLQSTVTTSAFIRGLTENRKAEEEGSPYMKIAKTASPESVPNGVAATIVYTIRVEAVGYPISNVSVVDAYSDASFPTKTVAMSDMSAGSSQTASYQLQLNGQSSDSVLINTATVTADAGEHKGETRTATSYVIVGNPPTDCFTRGAAGKLPGGVCNDGVLSSSWDTTSWGAMLSGISQLHKSQQYVDTVCGQLNPIPVYLIKVNNNFFGCTDGGAIYIYGNGLAHPGFILAHETGHIIDGTPLFTQFVREGIPSEGFTPYALTYTNEFNRIAEDFAETMGLYVNDWEPVGYKSNYPIHYNFAKKVFGGVVYY